MKFYQRVLFHILAFLDAFFPGWGQMPRPKEDHLSHDSYAYWMTRTNRGGM